MSDAPRSFSFRLLVYTLLIVGAGSASVYTVDQLVIKPRQEKDRLLAEQLKAKERELQEKQKEIERLEERRKQLEGFVKRLKHSERRAQIVVLDQQKTEDDLLTTTLRFTEIDADGNPVTKSRDFTVTGQEVYVDCMVATFQDEFVENGDALKGKALLIFRRIFTNLQAPQDGYELDQNGQAPHLYAAEKASSPLEKEIWTRFWELADKPEEAQKKGLRYLQGKAPYIRLVKDKVYHIQMRATGELFFGSPTDLKK